MIKLLFVTEALQRNSGVASVVLSYMRFIDREIFDIELLTYNNGDKEIIDEITMLGIRIHYMPELSICSIIEFRKSLKAFFNKHKYEIVHSHFNQIDSILFDVAHKSGVVTCISHSHNSKLSDNAVKSIRNRIMCFPIKYEADLWAACSVPAGKCLYGNKFEKSKKSFIIRNGVDCDKYSFDLMTRQKIRKQLGYTDDDIIIGHVGGFRIQKNHTRLISIIELLVKQNPKYKLVMIGDGELKNNIEELVNQKQLMRNIKFLGTKNNINEYMNGFDLFILPSLYEGLPVVAIEAQTNGLNCIMSDSITKEANLTKCIYVSLNDDDETWCKAIQTAPKGHNPNYLNMVRSAGFDMRDACNLMQKKYIEMREY